MAGSIRCISKMNLSVLTSNITRQFISNGCRTLYTDSSIGMNDYRSTRSIFLKRYEIGIDAFRTKLQTIAASEKDMVFTEDLKAILHLVEKTPEEVDLLKKLLNKYVTQNSELRFGSFKFGPIVMRTLHYLNEPNIAKQIFLDPNFDNFFDQLTSYMVLLDLLYENQMYNDIFEVYNKIRTKFVGGIVHPKLAINVIGMSCYKANTPESLEYGLQICKELNERGSVPLRKFVAAVGALAIKQNKPEIAMELMSQSRTPDYITIRCVKVMALADMDKIDDILIHFQQSLRREFPEKNQYYIDVIDKVKAVAARLNMDENSEIHKVIQMLENRGYVYKTTFDEHISEPIQTFKRMTNAFDYQDQRWEDNNNMNYENKPDLPRYKKSFGASSYTKRYSSG
ncbi:hypothetical protein PV327_009315 [Microctonus hyperodae]|uniref:Uncharacterized protein n=1 Tax=Microctonus hyperodae TaxID=165561 RepID=A0AA39FTI7_MICHY|nr:hypothetical protein PV327_009315 [Microctonus hyperodae]